MFPALHTSPSQQHSSPPKLLPLPLLALWVRVDARVEAFVLLPLPIFWHTALRECLWSSSQTRAHRCSTQPLVDQQVYLRQNLLLQVQPLPWQSYLRTLSASPLQQPASQEAMLFLTYRRRHRELQYHGLTCTHPDASAWSLRL